MTYRVLGVKVFPAKNCGNVIIATYPEASTERYRTYGIIPLEKFTRNMSVIETAVSAIGKDVEISVDLSGNIADIKEVNA